MIKQTLASFSILRIQPKEDQLSVIAFHCHDSWSQTDIALKSNPLKLYENPVQNPAQEGTLPSVPNNNWYME